MATGSELVFYVNSEKVRVQNPDPECNLLTYLRQELSLTGTKLGCGEGGCGACTVLATKFVGGTAKHFSLNACLAPLCSMHGLAITTVEGLGSTRTKLHPVQETLASSHGSQCGFCTPGFVMSMYTLLCKNPKPKVVEIENAFAGNLCRCTGYRPILQGFIELTGKLDGQQQISIKTINDDLSNLQQLKEETPNLNLESLFFQSNRVRWYRPVTLSELLDLKARHPEVKIIIGNTEIGIDIKFKNALYPVLIAATHVPELSAIRKGKNGIEIGSSVTLADLEKCLETEVLTNARHKTKFFVALLEMLKWFASPQIKNVAGFGGNVMTASPISDLNPTLISAGCQLTLASKNGNQRRIKLDKNFFTGYRKTILKPEEILLNIELPYSKKNEFYASYKQSRRRDDDIAIVNAGFKVTFDDGFSIVKEAILAYGGMAPTTVEATNTGRLMAGKKWNDDLINKVSGSLTEELFLEPGTPGGMEAYRSSLSVSLFYKFYIEVMLELEKLNPSIRPSAIPPAELSAREHNITEHENPSFIQIYNDDDDDLPANHCCHSDDSEDDRKNGPVSYRVSSDGIHYKKGGDTNSICDGHYSKASEKTFDMNGVKDSLETKENKRSKKDKMAKVKIPLYKAVGKPLVHQSAFKQTTGEAIYVDDMPQYRDELYLSLVLSTKSRAKIIRVDPSEALKLPGVVGYLDYRDVQGSNDFGESTVGADERVFAKDTVEARGQVIGAILTNNRSVGRRAANCVEVQYEELKPIFSIEEAIAQNSLLKPPYDYKSGNAVEAMSTVDHVIEGVVSVGGQEHFYLEPNACLAVPGEDGGAEVFVTTQRPESIQVQGSTVLGVPENKIKSRLVRIGGGFGGKDFRPALMALPCMVAAQKYKRPVRCVLDRDEDMLITGGRNPFLAKYKVGFTKDGKLISVIIDLFANGGYSVDLSEHVMDRTISMTENSYNIPNFWVRGYLCKTNLPSNTAYRGFGGPQAIFICETYVNEVADFLGMPPHKIKELNMYREGDKTPYQQVLENFTLQKCWNQVIEQSDFHQQLKEVEEFNKNNRWKKRGVALIPLTYGIGFAFDAYSQAGALVNIYKDGSVAVFHGGPEMGQGLHTKMIQIAAQVLKIPTSFIHIAETNTMTVPNSVAASASKCSDLNGMAVLNACTKLMKRLDPIMTAHPDKPWSFWTQKAFADRVCLSATGHYREPEVTYDPIANSGEKYNYHSIAAACSSVEIDCLTGDHKVLRTDIVMDVGKSLNPAIDVGQIEGAFVQGYGLYTLEELKYSTEGIMYTRGPGAYKIPSIGDIPRTFNVTLLKDCPNPKAVYSSKAIGEPPLLTSVSVIEAIKFAIQSARKDAGIEEPRFRLDSPATCERIRMACSDRFTHMYQKNPPTNFTPWFADIW